MRVARVVGMSLLAVMLGVVVASAGMFDQLDKASYYGLLDDAKQIYANGGSLTDMQYSILVREGVIREGTDELDETGGPDGYDYYYIDSAEDDGPTYSWIDISESGTEITLGDDEAQSVALPFTFTFYDNDYTSVYISSNGLLGFSESNVDEYTNATIPSADDPDNFFAPYWDDFDPSSGGDIYYGTTTYNDMDAFVVSWVEVPPYNGTATQWATFQGILCEDGSMVAQYAEFGATWAGTPTIGTENEDGTDGLEYRYNTEPEAGSAVMFYHEAPEGVNLYITDVSIDPNPAAPGGDITVSVTVYNHGEDDAGEFDVELFADEDTAPEMGDVGDYTWTVESLGSFESTILTTTGSYDELGAYDVYFIVNTDQSVTERDYTDNITGPVTVNVGLPGVSGLVGEVNATGLVTLSWLEAGEVSDYPGFEFSPEANWEVDGSVATFTGTELANWAYGYNPDVDYDDHVIEASVARLDGNASSSIAIFTRASGSLDDEFHGYLFLMTSGGSYGTAWMDGEGFGWFTSWTATDAINTDPEAVNVMTVAMDGYSATYYINGTEVTSFTDGDELFADGAFGIATHDAAGYDNVLQWTGCSINANAVLAAALTHEENAVAGSDSDDNLFVSSQPIQNNSGVEPRGFLRGFGLDELDEFLGYNVYRDDVMIEEEVDDTTTTDQLEAFGEYSYYVTASYTEGETDPSNTVTIIWTNPEAVSGNVTECTDMGAALEGVEVYADNVLVATTDVNGDYAAAIDPGTYDITFMLDGYIDTIEEDYVVTGASQTLDAVMLYPEGDIAMTDIEITVKIGDEGDSTGTAVVTLGNTGCGPLNYTAMLNVIETPYSNGAVAAAHPAMNNNTPLRRVGSINLAGESAPEIRRGPVDVAANELDELWDLFDGFTYDVSGDEFTGVTGALVLSDRLITCEWGYNSNFGYYEIDFEGNFIVDTDFPAAMQGVRDFEWDGTYIYGANRTDGSVYRWLPGEMETSYELVTDAGTANLGRGIALDPATGDIYLSDWEALEKLTNNGDGTYTRSDITLPAGPSSMYGIGWMPNEPNGRNLMLFCQLDQDGDDLVNGTMFFMAPNGSSIDDGYIVYDDDDAASHMAGGVAVTTAYDTGWYLIATMCQGYTLDLWEGYEQPAQWLSISPSEGTIEPDAEDVELTITADFTAEHLGFVPDFNAEMGAGELYIDGAVWAGVGPINVIVTLTTDDVAENDVMPSSYALHQNYPNPFNPTTQIRFDLAQPETVKLSVFNVLGQEVVVLANQPMQAGRHALNFDASQLASGLYFYRIEAGNFTDMKKMVLMK